MKTVAIMLIFFKWGYSGGMATAEFESMEACKAAKEIYLAEAERTGWGITGIYIQCAPKG